MIPRILNYRNSLPQTVYHSAINCNPPQQHLLCIHHHANVHTVNYHNTLTQTIHLSVINRHAIDYNIIVTIYFHKIHRSEFYSSAIYRLSIYRNIKAAQPTASYTILQPQSVGCRHHLHSFADCNFPRTKNSVGMGVFLCKKNQLSE